MLTLVLVEEINENLSFDEGKKYLRTLKSRFILPFESP